MNNNDISKEGCQVTLDEVVAYVGRSGEVQGVPGQCKVCGKCLGEKYIDGLEGLPAIPIMSCDRAASFWQSAQVMYQNQREGRAFWVGECPELYRKLLEDTAREEAKKVNWQAVDSAKLWNHSRDGGSLYLLGRSGSGKTTAAWAYLHEQAQKGRRFEVMKCATFFRIYDETEEVRKRTMRRYVAADILFLDDFGKHDKNHSRQELDMFAIIEERMEQCKPMVFTSRYGSTTLRTRFDPVTGNDMVRRVLDICGKEGIIRFD